MSSGPERNVLGLFGAFVACSLVMGLLGAGLALPFVGASGVGAKKSVDVFAKLPSNLEQPPLSEGSTVLDKSGKVLASFYEENRESVPLAKISPNIQNAVVAIEDARFYSHGGFDSKGLVRAFVTNQVNGSVSQGASTLTQQYVKNVLVEAAAVKNDKQGIKEARAKNNTRKLKEIRYAIALEKQLTKPEILERYLNIIWFGGKIYGVEAAAHFYYNTTAAKLNLQQSAMLAGMIQSPSEWDPVDNPDDAAQRRNTVLRRMLDLKMIDQATYETTREQSLKAKDHPVKNGCANAGYSAYFCDYVQRTIIQGDEFKALGATEDDRRNALLRGGYTIKTTIDAKIQQAAWRSVSETIPPKDKSKVKTAAVTIEPGTGKIRAMAQDSFYATGKGGLFTNYSVDESDGGSFGFQTGSTFKAFTLATWLKKGHTLNETVDASRGSFSFSSFKACGKPLSALKPYEPHNAGDGGGSGGMRVWDATANSVNRAYVSMEAKLDLCDIADTANDLGVHQALPSKECLLPGQTKASTKVPPGCPSLTLGVLSISPLTMAAAYATFASDGMYCKPRAVESITDRYGKAVDIPASDCKRALSEDVARGVQLGLSRVLTNGTAARVRPLSGGRPASGKTGTTNRSVATWFVGFTPQLATAVWVGRPAGKTGAWTTLNGRTVKGQFYGVMYGATLAAPIWKKIMEPALKGKKVERFTPPPSSMIGHYTPPTKKDDKKKPDNAGDNAGDNGGIVDPNR